MDFWLVSKLRTRAVLEGTNTSASNQRDSLHAKNLLLTYRNPDVEERFREFLFNSNTHESTAVYGATLGFIVMIATQWVFFRKLGYVDAHWSLRCFALDVFWPIHVYLVLYNPRMERKHKETLSVFARLCPQFVCAALAPIEHTYAFGHILTLLPDVHMLRPIFAAALGIIWPARFIYTLPTQLAMAFFTICSLCVSSQVTGMYTFQWHMVPYTLLVGVLFPCIILAAWEYMKRKEFEREKLGLM